MLGISVTINKLCVRYKPAAKKKYFLEHCWWTWRMYKVFLRKACELVNSTTDNGRFQNSMYLGLDVIDISWKHYRRHKEGNEPCTEVQFRVPENLGGMWHNHAWIDAGAQSLECESSRQWKTLSKSRKYLWWFTYSHMRAGVLCFAVNCVLYNWAW